MMSNDKKSKILPLIFTLLVLITTAGTALGANGAAQFKVLHTWPIGGDDSWGNLTLDTHAPLLYICRATARAGRRYRHGQNGR